MSTLDPAAPFPTTPEATTAQKVRGLQRAVSKIAPTLQVVDGTPTTTNVREGALAIDRVNHRLCFFVGGRWWTVQGV